MVEVAFAMHVRRLRPRHLQRRREVDRPGAAAVGAALADLAVRHVVELSRRGPRRSKREHIFTGGLGSAVDLEAALPGPRTINW